MNQHIKSIPENVKPEKYTFEKYGWWGWMFAMFLMFRVNREI